MKTRTTTLRPILFGAAALAASALGAFAQDAGAPPPPPAPPEHRGHRPPPPPSPLFAALDANHDGILSADEIKNASAALGTLVKSKDGSISEAELRPPAPPAPDDRDGPGPRAREDRGRWHGGPEGDEAGRPRRGGPEGEDDRPMMRHGGPEGRGERHPRPEDEGDKPGPREEGGRRGPRPAPPLMDAIDANHDGVISAEEMNNAGAALKKLDKNGDGQITRDEMRPTPPTQPPQPPQPPQD